MSFVLQRRHGDRLDVIEHAGRRLRFGRGTNVEVRIDDFALEFEHAVIEERDDGFYLLPLAKTTGSSLGVNGDALEPGEEKKLGAGDRIELGQEEITVFFPRPGEPLRLDMEPMAEAGDPSTIIRTITASNHDLMGAVERAKARKAREERKATGEDADPETIVPRPPSDVSASFIFDLLEDFEPSEAPTQAASYDMEEIEAKYGPGSSSGEDRDERAIPAPTGPAPSQTSQTSQPTQPPGLDQAEITPSPAAGAPGELEDEPADEPRDEPEDVNYLAAYRLPGGLGAVWAASFLLLFVALAVGGGSAILHTEALSPGPLGGEHETVEEITCASCHTRFLGVAEESCVKCHERIHDHQAVLTDAEPTCSECHLSHRGGDALRLADANVCVDCHGSLSSLQAASGLFADRITRFTDDHPELAIYVAPQERLRLDEARARKADPGGLRGFDHVHHLERLPRSALPEGEPLECADCHRSDEDGEILSIEFEQDCQGCHRLAIDPRFGDLETPHDEPTVVLGFLVGHYTANRRDLEASAGRLGARSLSYERRITRVAERVASRHFRDRCTTCHVMTLEAGGGLGEIEIEPPRLTERWFPHAEFRHGPHLDLTTCVDCHVEAPTSRDTADVLLPSLSSCQECHRRPTPEDAGDTQRLGRYACRACHTYHAAPVELNEPIRAPATILEAAADSTTAESP